MNRMCYARYAVAWVIGLATMAVTGLHAQEMKQSSPVPSVEQIVANTNQVSYYQGHDGRAKVKMTISDGRGNERNREFIILRRDDPPPQETQVTDDSYCGPQRMYVFFERPADVNKMVFMVWKNIDTDDDRWLYLPALDLVKRVAASDKRTSFVGSDFFYEDVSGRSPQEDNHELTETNDTYYVLKNTPKEPGQVEFAYYTMWIHRTTFLPIKSEYYDADGQVLRTYEALDVAQIQGFWTVTKARMTNPRTQSATILEYEKVEYNVDVPEEVFTERYLRRAPRKYLR